MIHSPAGARPRRRQPRDRAVRRAWSFRPVYGTYVDLLGSASFRGR